MSTVYVSVDNLRLYDTKIKQYIENGWYNKTEMDEFLTDIEEREANFVTRSVEDLANYYLKSETYNRTEIDNKISQIPKFSIQVVNALPTEDISETTIYLVPSDDYGQDMFAEYIFVENRWELLGTQLTPDLNDYITREEFENEMPDLDEYVKYEDLDEFGVTGIKGVNDLEYQTGNVTIDKGMVGLSQVDNKSSLTIRNELTADNVRSALQYNPLNSNVWVPNSSNDDGYVTKSNGAASKAWATDENGVPGWRDFGGTADDIDLNGTIHGVLPIVHGGTGNDVGYIRTGLKANTVAGSESTAEGSNTAPTGSYAHAEGRSTNAAGTASHSEGYYTVAGGPYSHSEGYQTNASAQSAHVEGTYTEAAYANQHVSGKYNKNKADTLVEIGNGTSSNRRSNAFEVYSDGYISTAEGAKIKFGKDNEGNYGYYEEGSNTLILFDTNAGAGYITRTVDDLEYYYLKTETYTKTEVNGLISTIPTFSIQVVNALPTQDISTSTVYLLRTNDQSGNLYTEYIYVNNNWESLGSQTVDLTNYFNTNSIIPVVNGGTGANNATDARRNLGIGSVGTINTTGTTTTYLRSDGLWAKPPGETYEAGTGLSLENGVFSISTVPVENGGTGASTASQARTNLGLGNVATLTYSNDTAKYLRNDGTWATPPDTKDLSSMTGTLPVAKGGTGATTASDARSNLGIGDVGTMTFGSDTTKYLRNDGTWQIPTSESDFDYRIVEEEPEDIDEGEVVFITGENYEGDLVTTATRDLQYYYLKTETYNKTEVDAKISQIPKFDIEVVNALPSSDISETTIYLLRSSDTSQNLYTEYIYVNSTWEILGGQTVDLTGYVKTTDVIDIAHGGTGASTAANARTALGIGNVGTFSTNGSTSAFLRGDGSWATPSSTPYTAGTGLTLNSNEFSVTTIPIANGGTGATTVAGARNALGLGNTSGALPIANGGTGLSATPSMLVNLASTSADDVLKASPRPGVTGTLPIANGGTGATSASAARTNLGLGTVATLSYGSDTTKYLRNDGTWVVPPQPTVPTFTIQTTEPTTVGANEFVFVVEE